MRLFTCRMSLTIKISVCLSRMLDAAGSNCLVSLFDAKFASMVVFPCPGSGCTFDGALS